MLHAAKMRFDGAFWSRVFRSGCRRHGDKQQRDYPEASFVFPGIAAEKADNNVGDQAEYNAIGDVGSEQHDGKRKASREGDREIIPVDSI